MVTKLSKQARYERRQAVKKLEIATARAALFEEVANVFTGRIILTWKPVPGVDRAIGVGIEIVDQDTTLPEMDTFAQERGYTLQELLDLLGSEAGYMIARARHGDVQVNTVGKAKGVAAEYPGTPPNA